MLSRKQEKKKKEKQSHEQGILLDKTGVGGLSADLVLPDVASMATVLS